MFGSRPAHLGVEGVVQLERILALGLVQLLRQGGDVEAQGAGLKAQLLAGQGPARQPRNTATGC